MLRSIAIHPASTTHSQLARHRLAGVVTPGYVRLLGRHQRIDDIIPIGPGIDGSDNSSQWPRRPVWRRSA